MDQGDGFITAGEESRVLVVVDAFGGPVVLGVEVDLIELAREVLGDGADVPDAGCEGCKLCPSGQGFGKHVFFMKMSSCYLFALVIDVF
jgi:hypothetical protein